MRTSSVFYGIGKLMQVLGLALLVPLAIAVYDYRAFDFSEILAFPEVAGFVVAILICLSLGSALAYLNRSSRHEQGIKEGYAIVTLGWVMMALMSAIPFFLYFLGERGSGFQPILESVTDAVFEMMSGLTTTGATILTDIESVPRSLLFLRSLTHWLGGMGIITLAIAIFPSMGVSAYQMFRGEVPGPSKDKLQPRLAQTVTILWGVYVLFTGAETLLLLLGGMDLFEAVCHSFSTMATGGFSTRNGSVAAFDSEFIHWVIILFMYLAGVNFLLHFRALRGNPLAMFRDKEFLFYNGVIGLGVAVTIIVLSLSGLASQEEAADHYRSRQMTEQQFQEHYQEQAKEIGSPYLVVRNSVFQVLAIITTTGFVTADFDMWPNILRFGFVMLMFFGGCAGSTGGGMKMIRVMVVFKVAWNVLRKMTQPRLVAPVKMGGQVIEDNRLINIIAFFILFVGLFIIVALSMTMFVPDLTTAVTVSVATLGNIGPGLAGVGAIENYGWIPVPGKWLLMFSMLLGRLEIFTVLIVLRPSVWRQ